MADDGATVLSRQSAGDLLGGHSHRKAVPHQFAQVRLARQLEALVAPPSPVRQAIGTKRVIAARPDTDPTPVALQLPADRRLGPAQQPTD